MIDELAAMPRTRTGAMVAVLWHELDAAAGQRRELGGDGDGAFESVDDARCNAELKVRGAAVVAISD
jgi:hypothetical protein